jgi:hypothetical protein
MEVIVGGLVIIGFAAGLGLLVGLFAAGVDVIGRDMDVPPPIGVMLVGAWLGVLAAAALAVAAVAGWAFR